MFELGKTDHWWEIAKRYPSLSNHPNTLKPLGYAHIVNLIESFNPKRVLEVGHGAVSFIFQLFADKIEMWGLDDVIEDSSVYEEDLKNVRLWNPKVKFIKDLLGRFSKELPDNYFDLVYSVSVIEHIPHDILPSVFEDTFRILKPGGIVSHSYDVYYKQSTKEVFDAYENANFKWLKPKSTMNVFWEDWLGKFEDNIVEELFEKVVFENPIEVAEKYMWQQDREYRSPPINFLTVLNAGIKPESKNEKDNDLLSINNPPVLLKNINNYTFSKRLHMKAFSNNNYDEELYGKKIDIEYCDMKIYQNLLLFSFIKNNLKPGAKILEIGNNLSHLLNYLKTDYECWNVNLSGEDNKREIPGIRIVNKSLTDPLNELPENYFDLIFTCSVFGQEKNGDFEGYSKILNGINRLLNNDGISIQTIVALYQDPLIWNPEILNYFFENKKTLNEFVPMLKVIINDDLFTMSEKYYSDNWEKYTLKPFRKFGKPLSYNVFWKK